MSKREDLKPWVIDALRAHGGRATIIEVCQHIWEHHEGELKSSGDLFYTWQYDVRWAAQALRNNGTLRPVHGSRSQPWELA